MNPPVFSSSAPPSPCIGLCRIDPANGLCAGCWRTLDEIATWRDRSPAEQRQLLAALEARRLTGQAIPSPDLKQK